MRPTLQHAWDLSPEQAFALQNQWRKHVIQTDDFSEIKTIAGVDVAYSKDETHLVGAVVVLDAQSLEIQTISYAEEKVNFPYVPGLFSFRELPSLLAAFAKLETLPDLVVCDGQGIAHPRRFGLACHLGLMLDIPTLGCAKKRFIGEFSEPATQRGASSDLIEDGEIVGKVLRTQTQIKPVFVSVGHRISLASACDWVLKLTPHYRLPETTRAADHAVREYLKAHS
jgi:deoxyribonuclease V